jgi:tRNA G37 N-methylase Trm5
MSAWFLIRSICLFQTYDSLLCSRGNVNERRRARGLVNPGDVVVDL